MHLGSRAMPFTRNTYMMASHPYLIITMESWDIGIMTAHLHEEAFPHLEEIYAERWEEEVDALIQSTWKIKMNKNPLWETKWEYIKEWQRGILVMTTSEYHNLVIQ